MLNETQVIDLKDKAVDPRVKIYKSVAGIISGGSFISELLINKVPNQKLDNNLGLTFCFFSQ